MPWRGQTFRWLRLQKLCAILFPLRARAYESAEGWGLHFLARMEPLPAVDGETLARRLPVRAAADLVEWNEDSSPAEIFTNVLGRERSLDRLIAVRPGISPITERPSGE